MTTRRTTREWALQVLFHLDLNPVEVDTALRDFWEGQEAVDAPSREFTESVVRGVTENRAAIDEKIAQYAENWDIRRMGVVDRNVLRMAIHEMLHRGDVPPIVSINEAVDIAKNFSSNESGRFVNGILDKVMGDLERPARG